MAGVITRRKLIAGVAAGGSSIALSAWTGPTYNTFFQDNVLSIGEWLNYRAQRLLEHFSIRLGVSRVREISVAFFFGNTFEK